ncbi:MAG: hypothetical protein ABL955_06550, partial [Elusimicrobiota bacterium]
ASNTYTAGITSDPGSNLFAKVFDQSGNFSVCSSSGGLVATSNIVQVAAAITEDSVAPSIGGLDVRPQAGGQTANATWSASDDKTATGNLFYEYAIDKPIELWVDGDVKILGVLAAPAAAIDISSLTEGSHTLVLAVYDQEGNIADTSVRSVSFSV